MKKLFAVVLSLAMVLSLAACGKEAAPTEPSKVPTDTDNQVYTEPSNEDTVANVYFLNHDAATDAAWQTAAEAYEIEFGVSVKVLTAAEAYYSETLAEELNKDEYPTLFFARDEESLKGIDCLDLSGTDLTAELTAGGKAVGVAIPTGGYLCVNTGASQLDADATVAFLNWALTTQAETLFPQN